MLKYADYVKKTKIFLYTCAVAVNILSKYLVALIIENVCLDLYVEVTTRMRYYTNILLGKTV
jgi:hypothetical protein